MGHSSETTFRATPEDDHLLAANLAESAGKMLVECRNGAAGQLLGGSSLAHEGDQRAHLHLLTRLQEARPDDAVLSEEGADDAQRLDSSRLWVIDPLDGSRDYGFGNDEWAVHVGLVEDGKIAAGAVALPALDLLFHTGEGEGTACAVDTIAGDTDAFVETGEASEIDGDAFVETGEASEAEEATSAEAGETNASAKATETDAVGENTFAEAAEVDAVGEGDPNRRPVIVTARSRVNAEGMLLAHELGADVFACGSAGVKAMLVVNGTADAYVHASPLYEWDVCAPAAVAQSAGLHVSDAAGDPLVFNQARPVVNSFLVCRPELVDDILSALSSTGYFRPSASVSRLRF